MPLIDVLILCALEEEFATARAVLDRRAQSSGDTRFAGRPAYLYRVPCRALDDLPASEYTVAVCSDYQMGGEKMAQFASDAFAAAKPHAAILTGIAATARPGVAALGDVAVSSHVFSYTNVAVIGKKLLFRKGGYQVSAALRRAAGEFRGHTTYPQWRARCAGEIVELVAAANISQKPPIKLPRRSKPSLIVAEGAGGPFLIRSKAFRGSLTGAGGKEPKVDPNVTWVEMEAHGFMEAAHVHEIRAIVMKGISDEGDEKKAKTEKSTNGFWRFYSAANAASAIVDILERRPFSPVGTNLLEFDTATISALYVQDARIFSREVGLINLGLPRLLSFAGPSSGVALEIAVRDAEGNNLSPIATHFNHRIPIEGRAALLQPTKGGLPWKLSIPDTAGPSTLGAALVLPEATSSVQFRAQGRFGVSLSSTWKAEAS
jgi:nucleoside phosphorylase